MDQGFLGVPKNQRANQNHKSIVEVNDNIIKKLNQTQTKTTIGSTCGAGSADTFRAHNSTFVFFWCISSFLSFLFYDLVVQKNSKTCAQLQADVV